MRRSKSNPAKYTRNYRKISQRHMTGYGDIGNSDHACDGGKGPSPEDREQRRLEAILKQSESTWKRGLAENCHIPKDNENEGKEAKNVKTKISENKPIEDSEENKDDLMSLLSPELREQFSGMGDNNLIILPNKKSKPKSKSKQLPPLTPQEIKAAKALYKNTQRKLNQLEQRKKQKELRKGLYCQLKEYSLVGTVSDEDPIVGERKPSSIPANMNNAKKSSKGTEISSTNMSQLTNQSNIRISAKEAQSLLMKSSELGKKVTKKEKLKQLRQKEMLGIKLTEEERGILYVKSERPSEKDFEDAVNGASKGNAGGEGGGSANAGEADDKKSTGEEIGKKRKKKKKKRSKKKNDNADDVDNQSSSFAGDGNDLPKDEVVEPQLKKAKMDHQKEGSASPKKSHAASEIYENCISGGNDSSAMDDDGNDQSNASINTGVTTKESANTSDASKQVDSEKAESKIPTAEQSSAKQPNVSYAQMMFASLSNLKTKSDTRNVELANEKAQKQLEAEEEAMRLEEEERKKRKVYIPPETIKLSTMRPDADAGERGPPEGHGSMQRNAVKRIHRPAEIEESRYDLPVSAMEYEIIDAVRSNDCSIICGETGSGKSTQVPQFLYEAGFSTFNWWKNCSNIEDDSSKHLLIGVTQPRRVAAVSTAKRVCYEMGQGDGQTIRSKSGHGNLVAYQTRYETAGYGSNTHLSFMTDGVLLQEIQSDLLLRKYGAIIIDEAHERNLNTDVLLGLLSVSLPLRRKAAEEGSLPPLKLIIMSATLRVSDFTENTKLFPRDGDNKPPAVVTVPGRTHPVSIHHSKVTELDDYEKVALEKVCKIHRKLPPGGILVFLTGKQEIVRMVNRLKRRLEPRQGKQNRANGGTFDNIAQLKDVNDELQPDSGGGFRDMDDEEVDADLFQNRDEEDGDDFDLAEKEDTEFDAGAPDDDSRPKRVRILPLYSMLSAEEQAKVFSPVPDDHRLIVVATNIAETSITIPGISYVVDSGRQKCRNYHSGTGVASYDIMWISKAAADQRAGRAGRTGPGHCYRLYSSSVYSRYLDEFELPEVLRRPLEDIVLSMKAMNVSNVASFPFPTPPDQTQVNASIRLLANLGCVDVSNVEEVGGDGKITPLGAAVAKLPLGVRYGKILLVAAQANVLDYAIALVAVLSESNPFIHNSEEIENFREDETSRKNEEDLDEVDQNQSMREGKKKRTDAKQKWAHNAGDIIAATMAVGAFAYAGRGAGGASEKLACRKFCEENGLNLAVMQRISQMRMHLCKLARTRLRDAGGVAVNTGKYLPSMPPPTRAQECLLRQAIASGLLDNIARRAPPGVLPAEFSGVPRSAYISCNSGLKEPLYIDNSSTMHSKRPEWICYDSVVRKTKKDGTTIATLQRITPVDPDWLAVLCHGSNMIKTGSPLSAPMPRYDKEKDAVQCALETKFGSHSWEIPPLYVDMYDIITQKEKLNSLLAKDDSFVWFARFLLEGKVFPELKGLSLYLNDEPAIISKRKPLKKVTLFVSALSNEGVDSAAALKKHWAEKDAKFLFKALKPWVKDGCADEVKTMWINAVTKYVEVWNRR